MRESELYLIRGLQRWSLWSTLLLHASRVEQMAVSASPPPTSRWRPIHGIHFKALLFLSLLTAPPCRPQRGYSLRSADPLTPFDFLVSSGAPQMLEGGHTGTQRSPTCPRCTLTHLSWSMFYSSTPGTCPLQLDFLSDHFQNGDDVPAHTRHHTDSIQVRGEHTNLSSVVDTHFNVFFISVIR